MTERRRRIWGLSRAAVLPFLLPLAAAAEERVAPQAPEAEPERSQIGRFGEDTRVAREEFEFSRAERMLWLSDHMTHADSQPGATLRYDFTRKSMLGDGFEDEVRMEILKVYADGTRDVRVRFFGEQRQQPVFYPENLQKVRGNPVLLLYLQGDVHDMNRMTEGSWRYFHRRIKLALADSATVESIDLEYQGRTVKANRITIRPYEDDPKKARYRKFADKLYEFVLSEAIPGMLYSIRTRVRAPDSSDGVALVEEQLIFDGLDPGAGSS